MKRLFLLDAYALIYRAYYALIRAARGKVQPGSIVLFHNAALHTPEALPGIIEALLQQGYTFVPISQLILPGTCDQDYSIDHTGRQCPGGA